MVLFKDERLEIQKTCESCGWNDSGLCDKCGYFVSDDDCACKNYFDKNRKS